MNAPTLHEMKIFYGVICKRVERHFCQKCTNGYFKLIDFQKQLNTSKAVFLSCNMLNAFYVTCAR